MVKCILKISGALLTVYIYNIYTMLTSQLVIEWDISVGRDLPTVIQSNCLTISGLTKSQNILLSALCRCLLNTLCSPGNLFQCFTNVSEQKCLLTSNLNIPWHSLGPFPCVLSLNTKEKSSTIPLQFPLSGICTEQWGDPSNLLFSKPDPPKVPRHPQDRPPSCVPLLWMHAESSTSFLNCGAQNGTQRSRWGCTNHCLSFILPSSTRRVILTQNGTKLVK